jgi:hypothetical protein
VSQLGQRLHRFLRHRLAVIGLVIMMAVAGLALFAEHLAPRSPTAQQILLRLKPPGFKDPRSGKVAWLGTDHLGRDILSRIIYGSRVSLLVSLPAVAGVRSAGHDPGTLAGYYGGAIESVVMRGRRSTAALSLHPARPEHRGPHGPSLRNIIIVFAVTTVACVLRAPRAAVVLALRRAGASCRPRAGLGASDQPYPLAAHRPRRGQPPPRARLLRGGAHDHPRRRPWGSSGLGVAAPYSDVGAACSRTGGTTSRRLVDRRLPRPRHHVHRRRLELPRRRPARHARPHPAQS